MTVAGDHRPSSTRLPDVIRRASTLQAGLVGRLPRREDLSNLLSGRGLFGRFGYLVITQATVVALGVGYWTVTAREFPTAAVGISAAAVSAALFLGAIGVLGIGSLLLVELHRADAEEQRALVAIGVGIASLSALVLGLVVCDLSPMLGRSLSRIGGSPRDAALFVAGTLFTTVGSVLDSAAIGVHRSRVQWMRNTVSSALRVGAVAGFVALGVRSTTALLAAWVGALAVSAMVSAIPFGLWRSPWHIFDRYRPGALIRKYGSLALRHHVLNLAITSVAFFLPVLAALLLLPGDYAYFSVAFMVSSAVTLVPALLAMTLFAEATGDEVLLRRHIRRTIPIGFLCCGVLLVVFEPGATLVLGIFGHSYASHGAIVLRVLLLSGLPYVVKDHWVAIRRAQRRLTEAAWVVAVGTVAEAAGAAAGAAWFGVRGLCWGWIVATMAEALFYTPGVVHAVRLKSSSATPVPGGSALPTQALFGQDRLTTRKGWWAVAQATWIYDSPARVGSARNGSAGYNSPALNGSIRSGSVRNGSARNGDGGGAPVAAESVEEWWW